MIRIEGNKTHSKGNLNRPTSPDRTPMPSTAASSTRTTPTPVLTPDLAFSLGSRMNSTTLENCPLRKNPLEEPQEIYNSLSRLFDFYQQMTSQAAREGDNPWHYQNYRELIADCCEGIWILLDLLKEPNLPKPSEEFLQSPVLAYDAGKETGATQRLRIRAGSLRRAFGEVSETITKNQALNISGATLLPHPAIEAMQKFVKSSQAFLKTQLQS